MEGRARARGNDSSLGVQRNASPQNVESTSRLQDAISTFLARYAEFRSLREGILLERPRFKHERKARQDLRGFIIQAQVDFLTEARKLAEGERATGERLRSLQTCHDQLVSDHENILGHYHKTDNMETELGIHEYEMQKNEQTMAEAAQEIVHLLRGLTVVKRIDLSDANTAAASEPVQGSTPDSNPLLRHYFDSAGDVAIMRERLAEIEHEYRDARVTRQQEIDQEKTPDKDEDEFETFYAQKRVQAKEAFEQALAAVRKAEEDCAREGLDPSSFNPPKSEKTASYRKKGNGSALSLQQDSVSGVDYAEDIESVSPPNSLTLGIQTILRGDDESTTEIDRWLESVRRVNPPTIPSSGLHREPSDEQPPIGPTGTPIPSTQTTFQTARASSSRLPRPPIP